MPIPKNLERFVIVASYVSAGVKVGAEGIVIVNGKVIKVPPRGPVFQELQKAIAKVASPKLVSR
jgi:hypothetical protein